MFITKTDWLSIYLVHVPLTHTDTKFVFSSGGVKDVGSPLIGAEGRLTVS